MRKLLVSLIVAASLAVPSAGLITATSAVAAAKVAAPAAMTAVGKVVAVSTKYCTVTLANEGVFVFGKGCKLSKVKVGDWVTITWTKSGNWRHATKIVESKAMSMADMMKTMHGMMMH